MKQKQGASAPTYEQLFPVIKRVMDLETINGACKVFAIDMLLRGESSVQDIERLLEEEEGSKK